MSIEKEASKQGKYSLKGRSRGFSGKEKFIK
jgi:hypothetical protein